jgi:hypothetical protein
MKEKTNIKHIENIAETGVNRRFQALHGSIFRPARHLNLTRIGPLYRLLAATHTTRSRPPSARTHTLPVKNT